MHFGARQLCLFSFLFSPSAPMPLKSLAVGQSIPQCGPLLTPEHASPRMLVCRPTAGPGAAPPRQAHHLHPQPSPRTHFTTMPSSRCGASGVWSRRRRQRCAGTRGCGRNAGAARAASSQHVKCGSQCACMSWSLEHRLYVRHGMLRVEASPTVSLRALYPCCSLWPRHRPPHGSRWQQRVRPPAAPPQRCRRCQVAECLLSVAPLAWAHAMRWQVATLRRRPWVLPQRQHPACCRRQED